MKNRPLVIPEPQAHKELNPSLVFTCKTGGPDTLEMATSKRVRTPRPKDSETIYSLSRDWRINMDNTMQRSLE